MKYHFTFPKFDPKIYWSFGILLFFSLGLLFMQYHRSVDCGNANYVIYSENWSPNQVVDFHDKTYAAHSWSWDFGDDTEHDFRQRTFHRYKKIGDYIVTLTINGSCTYKKKITINSLNQSVGYLPKIESPNVVIVGDRVKFHATKVGGVSFEWSFGENSSTDALGQTVYYTFKKQGKKRISLLVNGDVEHIASKEIYVAPKRIIASKPIDIVSYEFENKHEDFSLPMGEVQKDPLVDMLENISVSPKTIEKKDTIVAEKEIPNISNEQFKLLLKKVISEEKTKEDFKEYLCGNYAVPVVVNNNKVIPFEQFCQLIAGQKIKLKKIRLQKNTHNCIDNINIKYKKKFLIFWK